MRILSLSVDNKVKKDDLWVAECGNNERYLTPITTGLIVMMVTNRWLFIQLPGFHPVMVVRSFIKRVIPKGGKNKIIF